VRELKRGGRPLAPSPSKPPNARLFFGLARFHRRVGGEHGAAARLGMKRTTLQAKMRKLGIDAKSL